MGTKLERYNWSELVAGDVFVFNEADKPADAHTMITTPSTRGTKRDGWLAARVRTADGVEHDYEFPRTTRFFKVKVI